MFFGSSEFNVQNIEVFKLARNPYRKTAPVRPFHAISYRIYGEAAYRLNEETITTKSDDILFVPANLIYTKDTQAEQFYVVHFYCDDFLGDRLLRLTPSNPETFRAIFDRLYMVETKKGIAYQHEKKQLLYQLMVSIEREWALNKSGNVESRIDEAIKAVHETYMLQDFSVENLAKQMNMSETYFRRVFRKATGKGPKEYVSDLRLERALELLRSGYYTVYEVAFRCGFSSTYYFSSFIKRMTGKSPREFMDNNAGCCYEVTEK